MRRRWTLAALAIGVLVGYMLPVAMTPPGLPPSATPLVSALMTTRSTVDVTPTAGPMTTPSPSGAVVYLVWATGGLPPPLVAGLRKSFDDLSIVKGDVVELAADNGALIPLDAVALAPPAHAFYDPSGDLQALATGTVVLGESSARLRGAGPGDALNLDGQDFRVAAIVADHLIGAAEVAFSAEDPNLPIATDRYALVRSDMARQKFEDLVRALNDGPAPLRIRSEGETPWLRHGDAVLPQVFIKEALGEFSYDRVSSTTFDQAADFIETNIVTARIPLLGQVRCHRIVIEMLIGATNDLIDQGLAHLVEPAGFAGCWFPRFIIPAVGVSSGVSRHAWGAAVDLNAGSNPVGSSGNQDPRLVGTLRRWGFTWGGDWLVPDPMHFEFAASN